MRNRFLIFFLFFPLFLFGADAANDIILTQRNSGNTGNVQRNVTGTANSLLGTNGSSVPIIITAGAGINIAAGVITATGAGTGTVTSVSFTGGLISVATATTTPALTVAGTSGGIPYFSSASTWASSTALAANALVIGGGAGVAPSTTTTATNMLTFLGSPTSANLAATVTNETGTGLLVFATDPTFTLTDVTTNNASTSQHGWLPKLPGGTTTFLRGDGTFTTPPGTGTVTVVGAGALASNAIVTGGGTTLVQTISTGSTLDASGNLILAGALTSTTISSTSNANIRTTKGNLHIIINVKDYGVTGNGVTDDTANIVSAIAAMTNWSTLYFPAGKYVTSGFSLPSSLNNISMIGDGLATTIYQNTPANTTILVDRTCSYVTLSDFQIDGAATTRLNGCNLRFDASNSQLINLVSAHCSDFAYFIGQHSNATPTKNVRIENCQAFESKGDGFHCDNVDGVQINNCSTQDVGDDAFACVGYESASTQTLNVSITGCRAYSTGGIGFRGIAILMSKGISVSDFKAINMVGAGIEIGDDGNNSGVFNEDIVIRNADLISCITGVGPYGAFGIYFAKRVNLQNVTVTNPVTGSCVAIADYDDVAISGCNLLVTRTGFCRGIMMNPNTTFNSRTFRTTWTNLNIAETHFNLTDATNNESIYLIPNSAMTLTRGSVIGSSGSQVNTNGYIVTDRTGADWKIGNNTCDQARVVFNTNSPTAVTVFNNN